MRKFIQIKDKELFEELSAIADNGGGEDEIWQGLFSDYEQKNLLKSSEVGVDVNLKKEGVKLWK